MWTEDLVSMGLQLALEAEVAQGAVSRTALLYHAHPRRRKKEVVKKRRKAIDEYATGGDLPYGAVLFETGTSQRRVDLLRLKRK